MDRLATAQWLRRHARSWQHAENVTLLPAPRIHTNVNSVYSTQRGSLVRRVEVLSRSGAAATGVGLLDDWSRVVRAADRRLRAEADQDDGRWPWVWASQLHMLFNRLGIVPDEEARAVPPRRPRPARPRRTGHVLPDRRQRARRALPRAQQIPDRPPRGLRLPRRAATDADPGRHAPARTPVAEPSPSNEALDPVACPPEAG